MKDKHRFIIGDRGPTIHRMRVAVLGWAQEQVEMKQQTLSYAFWRKQLAMVVELPVRNATRFKPKSEPITTGLSG